LVLDEVSMMTERKRLVCLVLIMTGVALVVGGIAIFVLYRAAIDQTRERLVETAQSQARLIEAVARFDAVNYPDGAEDATLSQIIDAHMQYEGFGKTSEFTLARHEGDEIVFLLRHRHENLMNPQPVPFDSVLAEPMRQALSGQSGTLIGLDYRGTVVIAAHEPVSELNLGIVAKIDMAEVRAPFVRSALAGLGAALLVIVLGSLLFVRVTNPMIRRLQELYVTVQQELAERKRAEEGLRIRDQAIRSTGSGVVISDARQPDQPIIFVNEAFERVTGYSAQEVMGRNLRFLQRDDCEQPEVAKIRAAVHEGREVHAVMRNYRKDGTRFWNELTISPVYDNQRELTHFVGIQNDITKRKEAEAELYESRAWTQAILNTAADSIITIDQRGIITDVNQAVEQMFGYTEEALIGKNVNILMPRPYCDEHDGHIARYLKTGEARVIGIGREVVGKRKDGSTFPVDVAVSEIGHLGLFTGVIRDISDRKELQKQVLEIAAEEDRRIGHELHDHTQQQLTGLGLLAQSVADRLKAAEEKEPRLFEKAGVPEITDMAARVAKGISESANHVHLLSRGLVPVEVDAEGLRAALSELASRTSELHDMRCDFQCDERVELADNFVATHLYRIAQEAVNNALKHSRTERIDISLTESNDVITMNVLDNGVGIGDERASGHGMGLRIMAYRAGLIGATLQIKQGEEGGTLVSCTVSPGDVVYDD
jgi:PAS domain S-box-containing protein